MAISGLSQYDLFQNFNQYNALSKIPTVEDATQAPQQAEDTLQVSQTKQSAEDEIATLSPRQESVLEKRSSSSDLQDISLNFNQNEEFSLAGKNSNLAGLDVEKAISDMKKDSVLEQYQYFVGSSDSTVVNDEDGLVFQKFPEGLFQ